MTRKVIIFTALAACLVGVARADWVCSDACVDAGMGFAKIQHCGGVMPAQGNAGTVCAKNAEFHKTFPTTQVSPCKSGECSRIACPTSYCTEACSAEGVNKAGIDCYEASNKMADTAEGANNKALAFGCHGSHAMDKMFMIGADHKACDAAPIMYKDAGADTPAPPTDDKPKETETFPPSPAKKEETLPPLPAKKEETTTKKEEDPVKMVEEKKKVLEDKKAEKAKEEVKLAAKMEEKNAKEAEKKQKEDMKKEKEAMKVEKETKKQEKTVEANKKEEDMLAGINDADKLKEARIAAEAAKSNKTITKVKVSKTAANASAACNETFASMSIDPSAGACTATVPNGRRLLNTAYDVAILVNPVLVNESALAAAVAAVNATTETANTTAILTSIPGVNMTAVNAFVTAADEAVQAEAELAAATTELATAQADLDSAAAAVTAAEAEVAAIETAVAAADQAITAANADVTSAETAAAAAAVPAPAPAPAPAPSILPADAGSGAESVRAKLVATVVLAVGGTLFLLS